MERDSKEFFQELKLMVTDYLSARMQLIKFEFYEKTAKISAALFSSLVIVLLASLMLFFLSIALGFYLGAVFDSYGTGFLLVTGLYLLMLLPFIFFRKSWIEKTIINRLLEELTEKEEEEK
jgi:uncharacterized membrane protein YqjE